MLELDHMQQMATDCLESTWRNAAKRGLQTPLASGVVSRSKVGEVAISLYSDESEALTSLPKTLIIKVCQFQRERCNRDITDLT